MSGGFRNCSTPFETQIAVARHHRLFGAWRANLPWPVCIELGCSEAEHRPLAIGHDLGAKYVAVEGNAARPVTDMNDTVVESDFAHGLSHPFVDRYEILERKLPLGNR